MDMEKSSNEQRGRQIELLAVSIPDAAWSLGVSNNHIRNLIDRGQLKRVRIGRRVLVTTESIRAVVSGVAVEGGADTPAPAPTRPKIVVGNSFAPANGVYNQK